MALQQDWGASGGNDWNQGGNVGNPYGIPSFSGSQEPSYSSVPQGGNVRVLEAATSVLEEKLAAVSLEASSANQTRIMLEEKVAALEQENAWLQQHVKAQKTDDDGGSKKREEELLQELSRVTIERDAAVASMKGQLNELRVGASAIGAKIALAEEVDRLKAQIAPLQAALEAERSWAKELEQQLEGEKTAKLALVAKSGAMVKALRQQLEEAKAAQQQRAAPQPGAGEEAALLAELDAKQALSSKQAMEREVAFLREKTKTLQSELETEKAKVREKDLRSKGKMDALIEKALAEREAALAGAYKMQIEDLLTKLAQAQAREKELMAALQGVMGGLK